MNSKRLLSALLCAIMLASTILTGCSESGTNADETTPTTAPDAAEETVAEGGDAAAEGSGEGEGHERIAEAKKRLAALNRKLALAEAVMGEE